MIGLNMNMYRHLEEMQEGISVRDECERYYSAVIQKIETAVVHYDAVVQEQHKLPQIIHTMFIDAKNRAFKVRDDYASLMAQEVEENNRWKALMAHNN